MRYLILFLFLATSILNASEVQEAKSILENSKKIYSQELEKANLEREKLLLEYQKIQDKLASAESEYKKHQQKTLSVENLEAKLEFLEHNYANLKGEASSVDKEIFNLTLGEINEENLLAFPKKYVPYLNMPEEVESFYSSVSQVLPVDLSEGKVFQAKAKSFVEKFKLGGVWIYPISFFAIISVLIIIFKFVEIFSIRTLSTNDIDRFSELMKQGEFSKAKSFLKKFPKAYKAMLGELFADLNLSKNLLEEVSYENMLKVGDKLHRGLGFISVTASIAPLLGLLGTVTGIIKTFSDLAIYGNADPNLLSSGISQALITTEYGLSLAIPAFVFYAYLSRRAKRILSDMEKLASVFISSTKV
ncbi:MAG: MotA/TolQ/ExbB proton channel family protein [Opitutales bacterium]